MAAGVLDGIVGIYDGVADVPKPPTPVICILDTEHPDRIKEELAKEPKLPYKCIRFKDRVEKLTGLRCLVLHYSQVTRKDLDRPNIKALLISARRKRISKEIDDEFFALIRETEIPTLGSCGGHELIVQAYGGKVGKMRPLEEGEKDEKPDYWPGRYKEWGFMKVRVVKQDPLFAGLGKEMVVRQFHAWEVTELPAEFEILASTKECKIEAIKHKEKILYGTQFHAELYDEKHPDGRKILENFFKVAGVLK